MHAPVKFHRRRFLYILSSFLIVSSLLAVLQVKNSDSVSSVLEHRASRTLLDVDIEGEIQCIPSGIHSFPNDFLTQEERQSGFVVIHIIIMAYVCAMIATICDKYFIPSLEIISEKLNLPSDVAGATFMAIGASSPELFSALIGSFVTEGDIGIGTIIGSAVFNILGITGVVGVVLWNEVLPIDWYPMTRDCIAYGLTVFCLIWIISDNIVTWWESVILLIVFVLYILLMYFNRRLEKCFRKVAKHSYVRCCCSENEEEMPLTNQQVIPPHLLEPQANDRKLQVGHLNPENTEPKLVSRQDYSIIDADKSTDSIKDKLGGKLCSPPTDSIWSFFWWSIMYPANFLFLVTIPDSSSPTFRSFFPITFVMSVVWIGVLSYVAVWMVTIIGYTFYIPDSVSGLTILAAGASVPDIISTVIVAKNGLGNMAISNLVGSNTFDISICLGIPWLAKTLLSGQGFLRIYSSALTYATATLLITLVVFFAIFKLSGWKLNRTVGLICLVIYSIFVTLACLYEFNVFGEINLPTCYL